MLVLLVNLRQKEDMMVVKKHPLSHRNTKAQAHTYNQTGGDLDCLSAISPEGPLPQSLVSSQRTNGTCNAVQKRHHRSCLSFFVLITPHSFCWLSSTTSLHLSDGCYLTQGATASDETTSELALMTNSPCAAQHVFYTPNNLCWHRGLKRGSECTCREAFAVKCVRTTCLFSKLQEDVVSRKHHEPCSDWEKLLFTNTKHMVL